MGKRRKQDKSVSTSFKENDLVAAKVKGFAFWPAFIEKVELTNNKPKYTVRFFGTNETSVTLASIKPFKDLTDKERTCKRPGFQEALSLCQERYDSIVATLSDKGFESHSPSIASSPAEESICSAPEEIDQSIKKEIVPIKSKTKKEKNLPLTDCDSESRLNENDKVDSKPLKSDGENLDQMTTVIEKIKEKIKNKLKEKEARKINLKKKKLSSKASSKIKVINKILIRSCNISKKLAKADSLSLSTRNEWGSAVQQFETVIPVLALCTRYYSDKFKDSEDFKRCHRILQDVCNHLKAAKKNNRLPKDVKDQVKHLRASMKTNKFLKKFVNDFDIDDEDYAMTERKENGVG